MTLNGTKKPLSSLVNTNPIDMLGISTANKFDKKLPFLLKILDVKEMLSIQVHPTKAAAEKGLKKK